MLEILTGDDRLDPEWLLKADYIVGVLSNDPPGWTTEDPHEDALDLARTVKTQQELVREHHARMKRRPVFA